MMSGKLLFDQRHISKLGCKPIASLNIWAVWKKIR